MSTSGDVVRELPRIWRRGLAQLQKGIEDSPSHDLKRMIKERAEAFQVCIDELESALRSQGK